MEITYLLNSGFMVRDENILMLFDDFDDPAQVADRAIDQGNFDYLYIFVSHAHFDHFGTHIRAYAPKVSRYIFSSDIKRTKRVKIFPTNDITFMKKYTGWQGEAVKVWTYDSTDVGVSFLIETISGKRIFHAGDFNWWNWEEDSIENRLLAERVFKKQLKRMKGLDSDIAFFPVDGRLGDSQELGVTEFIKQTEVKTLVAMHRVGYPAWIPSRKFLNDARDLPIWSPTVSGERRSLVDGQLVK